MSCQLFSSPGCLDEDPRGVGGRRDEAAVAKELDGCGAGAGDRSTPPRKVGSFQQVGKDGERK